MTTAKPAKHTCERRILNYYGAVSTRQNCGKPAKEQHDGEWLCGPHLGGARRSAAKQAKNEARYAERRTAYVRASAIAEALGHFGLSAHPESWGGGGVVLSADSAAEVLAMLRERKT